MASASFRAILQLGPTVDYTITTTSSTSPGLRLSILKPCLDDCVCGLGKVSAETTMLKIGTALGGNVSRITPVPEPTSTQQIPADIPTSAPWLPATPREAAEQASGVACGISSQGEQGLAIAFGEKR